MKFKARLEVEFEFEAENADSLGDAQYQGRIFLQTQLHLDEDERKFKVKRYDIKVVEEPIEHCMYYIYHEGGYYKDADGSYSMVDNFGKHDYAWCLDYLNRCRMNSSPKKWPVHVLKVKKWKCGKWEWMQGVS